MDDMTVRAVTPLPGWFAAWDDGRDGVTISRRILAVARGTEVELIDGDLTGSFENPEDSKGFLGFFHSEDDDGRAMLARAERSRP